MATKPSGIAGFGLNNRTATYLQTRRGLGTPAARDILQSSPDMDIVRQRQAEYEKYLGKTDYSAQNKEAADFAKLRFALSLMGRGFAAMGAVPEPKETPAGTLARTLFAPIAGDVSTIVGPLMKQRAATRLAEQQEERQLKLAALKKVEAENVAISALALKLTPETVPHKLGLDPYVVVLREAGEKLSLVREPKGNAAIQVRQGSKGGVPTITNIKTRRPHQLLPGQEIMKISEFTEGVGTGGKAANAGYMQHIVTKEYQKVVRRGAGQRAFFALSGKPVPDTKDWVWVGNTIPKAPTGTEAGQRRKDRFNLLLSSMNQHQVLQKGGRFSAYSPRSALYFDQSAYLAKKSPWKYIPPGTKPEDRSQDVTITNPKVLELIKNKVSSVAQEFLISDVGSRDQAIKPERLAKAVKSILSLPPETVFGASPIANIGTRDDQIVGYSPTAAAFDPAIVKQNIRTAMTTLREEPDAIAADVFGLLPYPDNVEALNKPWARAKIAATAFPSAFGEVAPDDFDLVQQRKDIERVLPNIRLRAGAMPDDHKALIQDAVIKKVAARDKLQNSVDARLARESFGYALEFRGALLAFKNAAAQSNVEGFFTGTGAGLAARLGFADWIVSEKGAEHWRRLAIASTRFQEGISRRVGKDFGDDRISNLDAKAYQKLVAGISNSKEYNRILIEDGLLRVGRDLTDLMAYGGKVNWTERNLRQAAEAGVDFSGLPTQMDWHGHGYYGKDRYASTRQRPPSLTEPQRNAIRSQGHLKDTMYGGEYTVPMVDYRTDSIPTFTQRMAASGSNPAVPPTETNRMGPAAFEVWLKERATLAKVSIEEMRRRVVRGIRRYNTWRDSLQ